MNDIDNETAQAFLKECEDDPVEALAQVKQRLDFDEQEIPF